MALRGTLTHRKTRRLAKALGVALPFALGVLEALWHVAGEQAKDGGIGRMSNQDIADEMFWDDCADSLIEALVSSGWLDEVEGCRLYVHDWHEHSDDATDVSLARSGVRYADGSLPRMKRLSEQDRAKICAHNGWVQNKGAIKGEEKPQKATQKPQRATACHKKPLPVPVPEPVPEPEPEPEKGARARDVVEVVDDKGVPEPLRTVGFLKAWAAWRKYRRERRKPLTPSTVALQLADLAKHGPDVAAAMIHQSILKGWEGLFPLKDHKPNGSVADVAAERLQSMFGPNWREEIGLGGAA